MTTDRAYERLSVLYRVSKLLAFFESVEVTFPKILSLCASAFPLETAVLIEKRNKKITTTVWQAGDSTQDRKNLAVSNAKKSFAYFTGLSIADFPELMTPEESAERAPHEEYIVLPLIVDNLPPFGVLQLSGLAPLNEKDLEFVNSLGDLIGVAVDRDQKTKAEFERRELEKKNASSKLSTSQAQVTDLETERELRESFVSLLSHDLLTPLSAVKMSAQLILRQAGDSESLRSLSERIVSNVRRADQMITDLLDANRIRTGEKLPLSLEPFDLYALVKETLDDLATVQGDRFVLVGDLGLVGHWDRRGLRRIIENLCNNAVKYGSPEGPVTVSLRLANEKAFMEVQNWGDLISLEDQKSLFQQFRRAPKADGGVIKGWGIGLTLVRGVAEAHGGSVKVESETEKGTVFTVMLPLDFRNHLQTGII